MKILPLSNKVKENICYEKVAFLLCTFFFFAALTHFLYMNVRFELMTPFYMDTFLVLFFVDGDSLIRQILQFKDIYLVIIIVSPVINKLKYRENGQTLCASFLTQRYFWSTLVALWVRFIHSEIHNILSFCSRGHNGE